MIKLYLKQAWQLCKQNPLFSSIYVLGTGVAMALIMTLVIIYYVKIAPVYPEQNRNRTLACRSAMLKGLGEDNWMNSGGMSYEFICNHIRNKEGVEAATIILRGRMSHQVEMTDGRKLPVDVKYTDTSFGKVFSWDFVSGKPFSEADFQSGLHSAVLSRTMSRMLFGEEEAVNRIFILNDEEYKVCGVVEDVSSLTPVSYANIWLPFTVIPEILEMNRYGVLGPFETYVLARDKASMETIRRGVDDAVHRINSSQKEYNLNLMEQPAPYWKSIFYSRSSESPDWMELVKTLGMMFFALLFIPALNLAGLISSRMEQRLSEFGLRQSFGAPKRTLLMQILTENLVLTTMGGIVGLLLSFLIIYLGSDWLPMLFDGGNDMTSGQAEAFLTPGMLFNPAIFGGMFLLCLILNIISAILPAVYALKKNIVYSLNSK